MTIFSIGLNPNFKFSGKDIYSNETTFRSILKKHSLNDQLCNYELDDKLISVDPNNFPLTTYLYNSDQLSNYIKSNHEFKDDSKEKISLYPEWLLFYISVQKSSFLYTKKDEFEKHIPLFKTIAEVRHKNYIKQNSCNFTLIENNDSQTLNKSFEEFISILARTLCKEKLFDFLAFLWKFHDELKANEKYKLMWNLETYIIECIHLLTDKGIDIEYIYYHHRILVKKYGYRGNFSPLHEIQRNIPLYIKENKPWFETLYLNKINVFLNIKIIIDELLEVFTSSDEVQNLIFSYLEVERFCNSNKFNEFVTKSLIKNFVLEVESLIFDNIPKPEKERDNLFNRLKNIKDENLLIKYRNLIKQNANWSELSTGIKTIQNKAETIEKHLMIYYHYRNYFAHNNVILDELIWSEDRKYIRAILESAIITIYFIATFESI